MCEARKHSLSLLTGSLQLRDVAANSTRSACCSTASPPSLAHASSRWWSPSFCPSSLSRGWRRRRRESNRWILPSQNCQSASEHRTPKAALVSPCWWADAFIDSMTVYLDTDGDGISDAMFYNASDGMAIQVSFARMSNKKSHASACISMRPFQTACLIHVTANRLFAIRGCARHDVSSPAIPS